jgi:hypothetical protein
LGFPVLSDDVVVLREADGVFFVEPAYPRVRLWPESVSGLFGSEEALPRITPTWGKRYLDLNGPNFSFQAGALPLAAVYLLGARSASSATSFFDVDPRTGLVRLVAETYGGHLLDPGRRAEEFEVLGRLVRKVPVRRINVPEGLECLPDLCQSIMSNVLASGENSCTA